MAAEQDKKDPHSNERITVCVFDSRSRRLSSSFKIMVTLRRESLERTPNLRNCHGNRTEIRRSSSGHSLTLRKNLTPHLITMLKANALANLENGQKLATQSLWVLEACKIPIEMVARKIDANKLAVSIRAEFLRQ